MKKLFFVFAATMLGWQALPAFAQSTASPIRSYTHVLSLLNKLITWAYQIFFIVAVGYILWAAFTWLQAGGEPKKVQEARDRLKYAIYAIVVALVSTGASLVINSIIEEGVR